MSLDEIRQFESINKKHFYIETLHQQGMLSDDDLETLREAAQEVSKGRLTIAAVGRWLNSKHGVNVSGSAVRNYLLYLS